MVKSAPSDILYTLNTYLWGVTFGPFHSTTSHFRDTCTCSRLSNYSSYEIPIPLAACLISPYRDQKGLWSRLETEDGLWYCCEISPFGLRSSLKQVLISKWDRWMNSTVSLRLAMWPFRSREFPAWPLDHYWRWPLIGGSSSSHKWHVSLQLGDRPPKHNERIKFQIR